MLLMMLLMMLLLMVMMMIQDSRSLIVHIRDEQFNEKLPMPISQNITEYQKISQNITNITN